MVFALKGVRKRGLLLPGLSVQASVMVSTRVATK